MSKVTFTVKGVLKDISEGKLLTKSNLDEIGRETVTEMKDFISKGISPVKGVGRFEAYSAVRNSSGNKPTNRYPLDKQTQQINPSKKINPVNLSLTGKHMRTLSHKATPRQDSAKTSYGVQIGHINPDAETMEKFLTHNEGKYASSTEKIPQRKYLPTGPGSEFIVSIARMIKGIYSKQIKAIIKSNRK